MHLCCKRRYIWENVGDILRGSESDRERERRRRPFYEWDENDGAANGDAPDVVSTANDDIENDRAWNDGASSGVSVSYDDTPGPDAFMVEPEDDASNGGRISNDDADNNDAHKIDASDGASVFKDSASKNDAYTGASVSDRDAPPATTVTPPAPLAPPATSPSSTPTTPPASFGFSNEVARREHGSDLDGTRVYDSDACARQLAAAHPPTTTRTGDAPSASVVFSLPSAAGSRPPGLLCNTESVGASTLGHLHAGQNLLVAQFGIDAHQGLITATLDPRARPARRLRAALLARQRPDPLRSWRLCRIEVASILKRPRPLSEFICRRRRHQHHTYRKYFSLPPRFRKEGGKSSSFYSTGALLLQLYIIIPPF